VGCYIWYSEEGTGRAVAPPSPLLAVPNVTAHRSTASVPITVLLYDGLYRLLLCGFNVAIKGLSPPPQERALYAMAMSFCLSVRLFVCMSPETRTTAGGEGLSCRAACDEQTDGFINYAARH